MPRLGLIILWSLVQVQHGLPDYKKLPCVNGSAQGLRVQSFGHEGFNTHPGSEMSKDIQSGGCESAIAQSKAESAVVCTVDEPGQLPMRAGELTVAQLIDLYMQRYEGRDVSRVHRLAWWRRALGSIQLQALTEDHVHAHLEALGEQRSRFYAGKDAEGRPIFKARPSKVAPATVNRAGAALAAVITWAIKRRVAPAGYVHPCRNIERRPENNLVTRFLSEEERERLLCACKSKRWPRLYLLVLMALTTGARKGELQALCWKDVDLERAEARVSVSKNGDPRVLPLVPSVVAELERFRAGNRVRVFGSARDPSKAFAFESQFKDAMRSAKVRDFTFHCLRHTCASILAAKGATLLEIADLLGHRQLQVTKRYAHLATSHKAALVNRVLGGLA